MNQTTIIITAAVSVITLILAIFGAGWLNYHLLKSYIDAKFDSVTAEFRAVRAEINTLRAEMETLRVEVRSVADRLDKVERQLAVLFKPIGGD